MEPEKKQALSRPIDQELSRASGPDSDPAYLIGKWEIHSHGYPKMAKSLAATSKAGNISAQGNTAFYKRSTAVIVMDGTMDL